MCWFCLSKVQNIFVLVMVGYFARVAGTVIIRVLSVVAENCKQMKFLYCCVCVDKNFIPVHFPISHIFQRLAFWPDDILFTIDELTDVL